MPVSDPGYGQHPAAPQPIPDAYTAAPNADANMNRAARADGVAAHHVEDKQALGGKSSSGKKARIDDVTKLVAEENAIRSKFPRYAGLERWELLEKMGDGAFSNVYRARNLEGNAGEVAIKVVRKFEMNSMQVSYRNYHRRYSQPAPITRQHMRPAVSSVFGVLVLVSCVVSSPPPPLFSLSILFTNPEDLT